MSRTSNGRNGGGLGRFAAVIVAYILRDLMQQPLRYILLKGRQGELAIKGAAESWSRDIRRLETQGRGETVAAAAQCLSEKSMRYAVRCFGSACFPMLTKFPILWR